jgi:hypothetical protein
MEKVKSRPEITLQSRFPTPPHCEKCVQVLGLAEVLTQKNLVPPVLTTALSGWQQMGLRQEATSSLLCFLLWESYYFFLTALMLEQVNLV